MKASCKIAFKIFYYLSIVYTIGYWVYICIDDWIFIEKYSTNGWIDIDHFAIWFMYFVVYFLGFSFYFWIIAFSMILIYHKIIPRLKR